MPYGRSAETDEADRTAGLLWGFAPLPKQIRLGGDFREAGYINQTEGGVLQQELITMNADLYGDVKIGRFRARTSSHASTGSESSWTTTGRGSSARGD
jgi:hypothetical protein